MHARQALVPVTTANAAGLLEDWAWLVGTTPQLLAVTKMGDAFLVIDDGAVVFLDTAAGSVAPVAGDVATFERRLEANALPAEMMQLDFLGELAAAGFELSPAHCFSYAHPPALGGSFDVSNVEVTELVVHFSLMGQLHEQVKELPPGTKITGFETKPG